MDTASFTRFLTTLCLASALGLRAQMLDSINPDATPTSGQLWGAETVVFHYQPGFSYTLTAVDTKLALLDGYEAGPLSLGLWQGDPAAGGLLLASSSFEAQGTGWSEALFSAPVTLGAGVDYYLSFYNLYFFNNADLYGSTTPVSVVGYSGNDYSSPLGAGDFGAILGFKGTLSSTPTPVPAVPEPATYGLGGAMLLAALAFRQRKTRRKA